MSNDLVKQWDEYIESMGSVMGEVEHMAQRMRDCIEELQDKLSLRTNLHEECIHLVDSSEAKLAKAVKALTEQAEYHEAEANWWDEACNDLRKEGHNTQAEFLRKTITELKGQNDG